MIYLYRHIRLDKNEVFYIGIGINNRAYSKHNRNIHWKRIVSKFEYQTEIMMYGLTWEEACIKEKEFIKLYGRRDLGLGTLVNMTDGGDGSIGRLVSEDTKNKISKKNTGRIISKNQYDILKNSSRKYWENTKCVRTEEFKNNVSKGLKTYFSLNRSIKFINNDKEKEIVKDHIDGMKGYKIAIKYNINKDTVTRILKRNGDLSKYGKKNLHATK